VVDKAETETLVVAPRAFSRLKRTMEYCEVDAVDDGFGRWTNRSIFADDVSGKWCDLERCQESGAIGCVLMPVTMD
jgi:hypothetical protein